MFSLACAMLLREGVTDPSRNIALVAADRVATILVSNQPLSAQDLRNVRAVAGQMEFRVLFLPGEETLVPELRSASSARTLGELRRLSDAQGFDYSPVFDSSPYFFNSIRLRDLPRVLKGGAAMGNVQALFFVLAFMLAASILVAMIIVLPLSFGPTAGRGCAAGVGRHRLLYQHRNGFHARGNSHDAATVDLPGAPRLLAGRGPGGLDPLDRCRNWLSDGCVWLRAPLAACRRWR